MAGITKEIDKPVDCRSLHVEGEIAFEDVDYMIICANIFYKFTHFQGVQKI